MDRWQKFSTFLYLFVSLSLYNHGNPGVGEWHTSTIPSNTFSVTEQDADGSSMNPAGCREGYMQPARVTYTFCALERGMEMPASTQDLRLI